MGQADQGNGNQGQEPGTGTQGQGQEPASQQGQNGGTGQEPGGQGSQDSGPADISKMSPEELATYAAKLQKDAQEARQEAGKYRTTAQSLQEKVTEAERAKLTEAERVQADLEAAQTKAQELETKVRDLTVGASAREALAKAGALNAMTAFKTLDLSQVETGPDGTPKADQLQEAIAALKASDPYLFRRTATADAGAGAGGSPDGGGSSINDFVRGRTGR